MSKFTRYDLAALVFFILVVYALLGGYVNPLGLGVCIAYLIFYGVVGLLS